MAVHSSILAWEKPMGRGLVGYSRGGPKDSGTTEHMSRTVDLPLQDFTESLD